MPVIVDHPNWRCAVNEAHGIFAQHKILIIKEEGKVVSTETDTAPGVNTGEENETENGELGLDDIRVQDFDNRHQDTLLPEPRL